MLKFTEAAPTAGLALAWRDFACLPFFRKPQHSLEQKIAAFVGADEV